MLKNLRRFWPFGRVILHCQSERGILLERFYLIRTPWCGIYLHHLTSSDDARALHDHPWPYLTLLLTGGYFEVIPYGSNSYRSEWRARWSLLRRPATWQHRLILDRDADDREIPIWTLFVHGPIARQWGFWLPSCELRDEQWARCQLYGEHRDRGHTCGKLFIASPDYDRRFCD